MKEAISSKNHNTSQSSLLTELSKGELPVLSCEELRKQRRGWMSMVFFLFLFPILFFVCVFFPMWIGWTIPFP